MRIATSTLYDTQSNTIDNLVARQQELGNQLSTGKSLTMPSDDPTHIAQDLSLGTAIAQENTSVSNISDASAELNTVDGALNSVTNIVQKARSIAVQGASDTLSAAQKHSLAEQVDGLLSEAIGLANTNYGGKYVFAGTVAPNSPPVAATGSPASAITFNGTFQTQTQHFANGQSLALSTTIQQAFNFQSADHSPDVFQTLMNLRDSLQKGTVDDVSAAPVNVAGTVVGTATPLDSANFATPLVPDSAGNVAFNISSSAGSATIGPPAITPASSLGAVIAAINAQTGTTGVSAAFNAQTERITLKSVSGVAFRIDDVASAGAANTANFTKVFALNKQADPVGNLSRQLGDIDKVLNVVLSARATIGSNLQALGAIKDQTSSLVVNNTKVQSGIEDADIAKVVGEFSQAQTVLQAAYSTTNRLESKVLFDFIK